MKPFDLEAALAGEPVVTVNRKTVTQLTYFHEAEEGLCLAGVVHDKEQGERYLATWSIYGNSCTKGVTDLRMVPVKREAWLILHETTGLPYFYPPFSGRFFSSKDEAQYFLTTNGNPFTDPAFIAHIEWEV